MLLSYVDINYFPKVLSCSGHPLLRELSRRQMDLVLGYRKTSNNKVSSYNSLLSSRCIAFFWLNAFVLLNYFNNPLFAALLPQFDGKLFFWFTFLNRNWKLKSSVRWNRTSICTYLAFWQSHVRVPFILKTLILFCVFFPHFKTTGTGYEAVERRNKSGNCTLIAITE